MKFTLEINCDNAAFHCDEEGESENALKAFSCTQRFDEVARILQEVAKQLTEQRFCDCALRDINGNTVGMAAFDHRE